ncbi:MAG TPA: nuclear transport factor 2 family protein [Pyrinomonadaceae bacterium]|nr:nuclear transport factor 2 family protein [Pyrinomonadaceae bacterium]
MNESTKAQQGTIEVEQHLRQLNDEWVKAVVRGDGETLNRVMADDFIFTYPLEGDDKAQFIADVTSGDLKIEHITREQLSVRVFGSTAVLAARDSATWLYHGRELSGQYKVILIYSKRENGWQLCAVQACPMQ